MSSLDPQDRELFHGRIPPPPESANVGDVVAVNAQKQLEYAAPSGGSQPSNYVLSKTVLMFTETAGAGTYTAAIVVPAGARVLEAVAFVLAGPWSADSAALTVGDSLAADSYLQAAQADLVTAGKLVDPYDPVTNATPPKKSWTDPAAAMATYGSAVSMYYAGQNGTNPGVAYQAGDTITAVVETTGAYDRGGILTSALNAGGSGYAPGDTGTIAGTGNGDATYTVLTVDGGGAVLTYSIDTPGTGYSIAADQGTAVTTGGGDGLFTVDVDSITPGAVGRLVVDVIGFGLPLKTLVAVKT